MKKDNYRITKKTYKNKVYMWDGKTEVLLSLFVESLIKIRPELNYNTVCKEILEKYVRKRENSTVGPTKIMREVLNKR